MAILACNILCDPNYGDMQNNNLLPIQSNLHLLCSCSSTAILTENIGQLWADKMCGKPGGLFHIGRQAPELVQNSWFDAGSDSYSQLGAQFFMFPVHFRVAGWSSALNDTLTNVNDSTSGSIDHRNSKSIDETATSKLDRLASTAGQKAQPAATNDVTVVWTLRTSGHHRYGFTKL